MDITFLRNSFANNSSSTHALVFCPDMEDNFEEAFEYGWGKFTLASKEAKLRYMLTNLWENWQHHNQFYNIVIDYDTCNEFSAQQFKKFIIEFLSDVFSPDFIDNFNPVQDHCYVDHQSQLTFPLHRNYSYKIGENYFNIPFMKDFVNFIVNSPFVILGGNYNGENSRPDTSMDKKEEHKQIKLLWNFLTDKNSVIRCEKDNLTGEYVLSDDNGPLMKVIFGEEKKSNKSEFPYLVDIKINNKCNNGCAFCYMGSEKDGGHANLWTLYDLAETLSEANVYEVVIGGGNLSEYRFGDAAYPSTISDVLNTFKNKKFKVSFTTRDYEMYKNGKWDKICENTDSIAVSCSNINDLKKAKKLHLKFIEEKNKSKRYSCQFSVQCILEENDVAYLKKFLKKCNDLGFYHVTILGAKECGRGKDFKWQEHDNKWIKVAKDSGLRIGIDSVLAIKYKDELIKEGVQSFYLAGEEGKQTCFIDAVEGNICSSSFGGTKIGVGLSRKEMNKDKFLEIFAKV